MPRFKSTIIEENPSIELGTLCKAIFDLARELLSFLSVSSVFIGSAGFFKTYIGYLLLGMIPNISVCFAVFLVCFSVYTIDKIADLDKDVINMPSRVRFFQGRKNLAIACASLAYLLSIIIIFIEKPNASLFLLIPIAVNAIYGTKLIPGLPRLKDIPVMKNFIVAFTWALVTIMIPAAFLSHSQAGTFSVLTFVVFYFMLIKTFIDTVLYDIRDEPGDRVNNVRTIPVLIGSKKTTEILLILNTTLLLVLPWFEGLSRLLVLVLTIYGYGYIFYFRERRDPLALDLCVEGECMLASLFLIGILDNLNAIW